MSAARNIAVIVACALGLGIAGGLLGFALGIATPNYYRIVFRAAGDPDFSPVQVGLGLGLTQGLVAGLGVGGVAVLAATLSHRHRPKSEPMDGVIESFDSGRAHRSRIRRIFGLGASIVTIAFAGVVGYFAGALANQEQFYQHSTDTKLAKIRPILQDRRFADVTADYSSAAQVYLIGRVDSQRVYSDLEEKLRFLFGDEEMRFMMDNVTVAKE